MLNYAYALLESQVRIATVSQGLDPTEGYLYACRPGRVAVVYDVMEAVCPLADRLILDSVQSHNFSPADFILREDGVCRLHPQLARRVAQSAVPHTAVQKTLFWLKRQIEVYRGKRGSMVPSAAANGRDAY